VVPGDMDVAGQMTTGGTPPTNSVEALSRAENQFNVMKPFTASFTNDVGSVQGFLNSFSAFTR
jgi:hypothetical protein